MRCKNCGWPNKPNETNCEKCHSPLPVDENSNFDVSIPNDNNIADLEKTVFEDVIFGGNSNVSPQQNHENFSMEKPCPKCGYPLRPGTDKCPNCKFQISPSTKSVYQQNGKNTPATAHRPTKINSEKESPMRGTVNPYMMNMDIEPSFVLRPLKRDNERHELNELEYEGSSVCLNRSNTEENNTSITSREQAVITNIEGHWYIEDKSEHKTSFVQAANKIELHDGDRILLGNRLFEFHE